MLKVRKSYMSLREQKELENLRAELNTAKEDMETQKLVMQYIAGMSDVYIPEEEDEANV